MADRPGETSASDAMRDRGRFWSPVPDWNAAGLARESWRARRIAGLGQTLISGELDAAVAALAPGAAEAGLWQLTDTDRVLVRIARDRALLVTGKPLRVEPGWHADGYVAAPCDDGYAVFEISGEGLGKVVAQASSADTEAGSRSASIMFAGVPALLYRTAPSTARVHVESPLAAYLQAWLEGAE